MAGILDIAKSAVNAHREALNQTGQNIANASTEGYRRREAVLAEVSGSQSELNAKTQQQGLGVRVSEIRRGFDQSLQNRAMNATAGFASTETMLEQLRVLENTLLPADGDLTVAMGAFFSAMTDVAASPDDLSARNLLLSQATSLTQAFAINTESVAVLADDTYDMTVAAADRVNALTSAVAKVNEQLRSGSYSTPSLALMDERDRLLGLLAEEVGISVDFGSRQEANVRLGINGSGPLLVSGVESQNLFMTRREDQLDVVTGAGRNVTSSADSGLLRGAIDSYAVTGQALTRLDQLARDLVSQTNKIHAQGVDLNGRPGGAMFASAAFVANVPPKADDRLSADFTPEPGGVDSISSLVAQFDKGTSQWLVRDQSGQLLGKGHGVIETNAGVVRIDGKAQEGDIIEFSRMKGDAQRLEFLLVDPESIAAASSVLGTARASNLGGAVISVAMAEQRLSGLPLLSDRLPNSLSGVTASTFRNPGFVGIIPQGAGSVELASFATQPNVLMTATNMRDLETFSFNYEGLNYEFDLNKFPDPDAQDGVGQFDVVRDIPAFNALVANNGGTTDGLNILQVYEGKDIPDLLNQGVLQGRDQAGNWVSLADLGMHAAGDGVSLSIVAAKGEFSQPSMSATNPSVNDVQAVARAAVDASQIQVFTREGRHIAGSSLSPTEIQQFLTTDNGFLSEAEYRADYLNAAQGVGYRGLDINRYVDAGTFRANFSIVSSADGISSGNGVITSGVNPSPSTVAQNLTIDVPQLGLTSEVSVLGGLSAKDAAVAINQEMAAHGIHASAQTKVAISLTDPASTGPVSFELSTPGGTSVSIEAVVTGASGLDELAKRINEYTIATGVSAHLTAGNQTLILEDASGRDVMLSGLEGLGLHAKSLGADFEVLAEKDLSSNQNHRFHGVISITSTSAINVSSDLGGHVDASTDPFDSPLVQLERASSGDRLHAEFIFDPETDLGTTGSVGVRAQAPSGSYNIVLDRDWFAPVSRTSAGVNNADDAAEQMVQSLRSQAPAIRLQGQTVNSMPSEGTIMTFTQGGESYSLRMGPLGEPAEIIGVDAERFVVDMPSDRNGQTWSISTKDGSLSGEPIIPVSGDIAAFGFDSGASQSLIGRAFTIDNGTSETFDVELDGEAITITVSRDDSTNGVVVTSDNPKVTAEVIDAGTAQQRIRLQADKDEGPLRIVNDAVGAAAMGIKTTREEVFVRPGGLEFQHLDGSPVQSRVTSEHHLVSERLSLHGLPDEELIVLVTGTGNNKIGASFGPPPALAPENAPSSLVLEAVAGAAGRYELIDEATGQSLATRTLAADRPVQMHGLEISIGGQAQTGDLFDISLNQRADLDGRNLEAMAQLAVSVEGRRGLPDGFRDIISSVGGSLEATTFANTSAQARKDAADQAVDAVSGVNLDEEAANLVQQQQAFQAAARVLQMARDLFETLLQIR